MESILLPLVISGQIAHSRILDARPNSRLGEDDVMVDVVNAIAKEPAHADATVMLFGAADWYVEAIVRNRARLSPRLITPYPDAATLVRATDKVSFGEAAERLGVPYPTTTVVNLRHAPRLMTDLPFPVVAKAASTSDFHEVEFADKQKVYYADNATMLQRQLTQVRDGGYTGDFLVQRTVRGGDDHMRVATCFVGSGGVGEVVVGRVLIEEHTPGALGNPAAILVEPFADIDAGAATLAQEFGWRGHANFDVKWDADAGEHVFFELNPRLGRSNFYLTASGYNPVPALVREYAPASSAAVRPVRRRARMYSIVPVPLLLAYVRDAKTWWTVLGLWLTGGVVHPLWSWRDPSLRRWVFVQRYKLGQIRKFRRYYPPSRAKMVL